MALISKIKGTDNIEYNVRDDVSVWGGRNLLPVSQSKIYNTSGITRGITINYFKDGWFKVSGTLETVSSQTNILLWDNSNGINNIISQNEEKITIILETQGTPFNNNTTGTSIMIVGPSPSINLGGKYSLSYIGNISSLITRINYHFDSNCSGVLDGYFRLKIERGTKPTDWSPAPEDIAHINDECLELFS